MATWLKFMKIQTRGLFREMYDIFSDATRGAHGESGYGYTKPELVACVESYMLKFQNLMILYVIKGPKIALDILN